MIIRRFDSSLRSLWISVLSPIFLAITLLCSTPVPAQKLAAAYTDGNLSITIHYHSEHAGSGKLIAEILDPEDRALGRTVSAVEALQGDGVWRQTIVPKQPLPFDEIAWQRIRYRFEYDNSTQAAGNVPGVQGIESISRILRRPIIRILGQSEYLAGSSAAIRVPESNGYPVSRDYKVVTKGESEEWRLNQALSRPPESMTLGDIRGVILERSCNEQRALLLFRFLALLGALTARFELESTLPPSRVNCYYYHCRSTKHGPCAGSN